MWIKTDGDEWRATGPGHDDESHDHGSEPGCPDEQAAQADAAFIVLARTALPAAIDRIEELEALARTTVQAMNRLSPASTATREMVDMSHENGLPTDTDLIMEARYYADEISRSTKGVTRAKTLALADGFIICDRQRAEQTIRAQTLEAELRALRLSPEEREALEWLVKWINVNSMPGVRPREIKARALSVLTKLLAASEGE